MPRVKSLKPELEATQIPWTYIPETVVYTVSALPLKSETGQKRSPALEWLLAVGPGSRTTFLSTQGLLKSWTKPR